jgi:hypothetical protein
MPRPFSAFTTLAATVLFPLPSIPHNATTVPAFQAASIVCFVRALFTRAKDRWRF